MSIWQKILEFLKKLIGSYTTTTTTSTSITDQTTTSTTTIMPSIDDQKFLQEAKWLGPNLSGNNQVTAKINSASMSSSMLYTNYDKYNWPSSSDGVCDAMCCIFYIKDGKWTGGKFDWWRKGGQGTKTLENVHDGYNGHSFPSKGTPVKTMISSVDCKQRSNICDVSWK